MESVDYTFKKIINDTIDATYLRIADALSEFARSEIIEDMSAREALDYFAMKLFKEGSKK